MKIKKLSDIKDLLLNQRTTKQVLFKNTFWIALPDSFGKLLRTLIVIYIARFLGAAGYGKFTFALAYIAIFVSFLDLGLSTIITRELAQDKQQEKYFNSLVSLKLILGVVVISMQCGISFFITSDPDIRKVIWILSLFSFVSQFPEIFYAFLRARQKMEYESWSNILQVSIMTLLILLVVAKVPSILKISYVYLGSSLITVVPLIFLFNYSIAPVRIDINIRTWKKYLSMSWPLALTSIFGMLYSYIDSVMMGYLGQMVQTGLYNAALRVVYVLAAPASVICLSFYPVLSKFSGQTAARLQAIWNFQLKLMSAIAIPIVAGGMILAPKIIGMVYGPDFAPAVPVLRILMVMTGITFLINPFSNMLISANHQEKTFWVTVAGAAINISLNLVLIPRYSLYGAAIASITTYLLILGLYFYFTKVYVRIKPVTGGVLFNLIRIMIACLVMSLFISWPLIFKYNVLQVIFMGAVVYMLVYYFLRRATKYYLRKGKHA
ncbi:MAG: flippase [bacterium]|nr:flippase [bacterium]